MCATSGLMCNLIKSKLIALTVYIAFAAQSSNIFYVSAHGNCCYCQLLYLAEKLRYKSI